MSVHIGRLVLTVTCLVVAGLGLWFAFARWEDANKVAAVVSALGAVAAVGVAVWAVTRGTSSGMTVRGTGSASAKRGGTANSGAQGRLPQGLDVRDTGDANADGGDANSGVRTD